jgi:uncharacterized protein
MDLPAKQIAGGILLQVRLTPKSRASYVAGMETLEGRVFLKAHVSAAPENGGANTALIGLLAHWLGVPKSKVTITSGHKSRLKSVAFGGNPGELIKKLEISLGNTLQEDAAPKEEGKQR